MRLSAWQKASRSDSQSRRRAEGSHLPGGPLLFHKPLDEQAPKPWNESSRIEKGWGMSDDSGSRG